MRCRVYALHVYRFEDPPVTHYLPNQRWPAGVVLHSSPVVDAPALCAAFRQGLPEGIFVQPNVDNAYVVHRLR